MTPRQQWQYSDCGGGAGCETELLLEAHMTIDAADPIAADNERKGKRRNGYLSDDVLPALHT